MCRWGETLKLTLWERRYLLRPDRVRVHYCPSKQGAGCASLTPTRYQK